MNAIIFSVLQFVIQRVVNLNSRIIFARHIMDKDIPWLRFEIYQKEKSLFTLCFLQDDQNILICWYICWFAHLTLLYSKTIMISNVTVICLWFRFVIIIIRFFDVYLERMSGVHYHVFLRSHYWNMIVWIILVVAKVKVAKESQLLNYTFLSISNFIVFIQKQS